MRKLVVFGEIGSALHRAAGHRPLVDAELQHHPDMHGHEDQQSSRDHENMKGEEARKSSTSDDGTTQHQIHQRAANERYAADDRGPNAQSPIGVLIEAEHLTGERHAQSHQQEKNADNPGEFARELVSSEGKDLRHVDEHNGDHEVGAPAVHRAQEPAERQLMIEHVQAVPGMSAGRHIHDRQKNAGDDLKHEQCKGRAAEDIPPACGIAWYRVKHRVFDRRLQLQPELKPVIDLLQPVHVPRPLVLLSTGRTLLASVASVGICPALMCNWFPATLY